MGRVDCARQVQAQGTQERRQERRRQGQRSQKEEIQWLPEAWANVVTRDRVGDAGVSAQFGRTHLVME